MLSRSKTETQIVNLDNCQFEQKSTTAPSTAPRQKATNIDNPLASSYLSKKPAAPQIKGLIVSNPSDGPLGKLVDMLANLLKYLEHMFLSKLDGKLPTIKVKTPIKKKKKTSIWELEEDLKN